MARESVLRVCDPCFRFSFSPAPKTRSKLDRNRPGGNEGGKGGEWDTKADFLVNGQNRTFSGFSATVQYDTDVRRELD
jgi:hypothetical protein